MTPYRLFQTRGRVLEFEGERVTTASSRGDKASSKRWWDYALYATASAFVLQIDFCSTWPGDEWTRQGMVCEDADAVEAAIEAHLAEILRMDLGFPPTEHFESRRRTLVGYLHRDAQTALATLLDALGTKRVD